MHICSRIWLAAAFTLALPILTTAQTSQAGISDSPIAIAIHGGAGVIRREDLSAEREAAIRAKLEEAVLAGHAVLEDGGAAIDAVTAAITILEDAPQFNAGRGAVLTSEGRVEMDASVMTGHDLNAGAVASVRGIRHPILAARAVLEGSPHVMLVGRGAETFVKDAGLEFMPEDWFLTTFRREQLQKIRAENNRASADSIQQQPSPWYSTVGTVALDRQGNIAAGTSTGGMSNKRFGRVGDSPIIAAGTYADNRSCAVSATGHGEFFIRYAVAFDICARMRYEDRTLAESAEHVVNDVLVKAGGDGGVIAIDAEGNISMPFNTPGMYRASVSVNGDVKVAIYGDE